MAGITLDTRDYKKLTPAGKDRVLAELEWMLGSDNLRPVTPESKDDAADTYTPPKSAQGNARKVLEWREKYGDEVKGMTRVGWTRASQLASGDPISLDTVKRMAQFNRHRQNSEVAPEYKDTPWKDAGHVAWLGWGGTTGIDWAMGISSRADDLHEDSAEYELEVMLGWRVDAPKGGKGGKKKRTEKPKCTKGRSCGMSCIPQNRKCKSDLSPAADVVAKSVAASGGGGSGSGGQGQGQAPQAAPQAAKSKATPNPIPTVQEAPAQPSGPPPLYRKRPEVPTDESVAIKNFRFIGDGIEGRVYVNPATGEALKYFNPSRGVLPEDFFGNTIKAGEVGIGPRLISVDPDYPVYSMEFLDGYENGLTEANQMSFLRNVKKAFDNDIPLEDLHEDNMMSKGDDIRFIDLGGESRFVPFSERANTLLNKYGWRALTSQVVDLQVSRLPKAQQREFEKMQKKYLQSVDSDEVSSLSEAELEQMVNKVYSLLGIE